MGDFCAGNCLAKPLGDRRVPLSTLEHQEGSPTAATGLTAPPAVFPNRDVPDEESYCLVPIAQNRDNTVSLRANFDKSLYARPTVFRISAAPVTTRLFLFAAVTWLTPACLSADTEGIVERTENSRKADPSVGVKNGLIAFTLRDRAGRLQIFTQKPDGSDRRQLTFENDNGRPDWSPDGKRIVFGSIGNGKSWVAVMDADGSNQRQLAEGTPDPDWSSDGKQIAFSHPSRSADGHIGSQIWLMNADGSNIRQVTSSGTSKAGPSWSPDGKQMVFILVRNPGSRTDPQPQIGIMNADGTDERILTTEKRVNVRREPDGTETVLETANDTNAPAWSPVDNRIAFWSGIETRYGQVWVINSDGTRSTQLTEDPTHRNSDDPSWSPDGKKILFSTGRSGRNELWMMDADGSNETNVSDIDASPFPGRATWQPLRDKGEEGE